MDSNKKLHFDSLTGIRGIAACWVVIFHMKPYFSINENSWYFPLLDKGYLAVDLFFILSGFVIYMNYADKLGNISSIKSFLIKRIARIYPLHFIVLICYLSVPIAIYFFSSQKIISTSFSIKLFIANLFLYQSWNANNPLSWNVPAWSISTEWFSYLAFCGLSFFYKKIAKHIWLAVLLIIIICITIAFLCHNKGYLSIGHQIPEFGIYRCLFEFMLGNLLALILLQDGIKIPILLNLLFFFGCVLLLFDVYKGGLDYFTVPLAFCFFITILVTTNWWIVKILEFKVFVYLGEISYSIYMWHYLIREWFKIFFLRNNMLIFDSIHLSAYFIFLIVLSHYSYKYIEIHARKKLASFSRQ